MQLPTCRSLSSKGECQFRELVMLIKEAWEDGLHNKVIEGGTNSEREQLMRREIPLAFEDNRSRVQDVKWIDNLACAKSFIVAKGRMPIQRVGDADERSLGRWFTNNKVSEGGTNSEREQLMRREIPLVFEDNSSRVQDVKWIDNLASAKSFIVAEGRMPKSNAGDADERSLGRWISTYKVSEGGTNSECEQLMRKEIPLAFA